jgi:hypothetical protein
VGHFEFENLILSFSPGDRLCISKLERDEAKLENFFEGGEGPESAPEQTKRTLARMQICLKFGQAIQ